MDKRSDGFTLVELMVVVLIIGILVAVAVPVFKAARTTAEKNTCQANQRTWAGVVEQIKAAGDEPGVTYANYAKLASGSAWYAAANSTYLKRIPQCPSAGGTSYWVYETPAGGADNGAMVACGGADETKRTSTDEHPLYAQPPTGAHQYWRVLATAPSYLQHPVYGTHAMMLLEVEFYGSPDRSGPNLCSGATAFACSTSNSSAAYASDGNLSSTNQYGWAVWSQLAYQNEPAWWGVNLGTGNAREVHSVRIYPHYQYYPNSFALQWSDDGSNWNTQSALSADYIAGATPILNFPNL